MATLAPECNLCAVLKAIAVNIRRKGNQTQHEAYLNGHDEAFAGTALCAFKGAQIETRFVQLDAGQPHRFAASGAVQNSDLPNAKEWIGLTGKHDAPP
jgi:hypothetical protein